MIKQDQTYSRGPDRKFGFLLSGLLGLILAQGTVPSHATVFELPTNGSAVIGADTTITSHYKDTLLDIARQYSLGYDEIIRANPGIDIVALHVKPDKMPGLEGETFTA